MTGSAESPRALPRSFSPVHQPLGLISITMRRSLLHAKPVGRSVRWCGGGVAIIVTFWGCVEPEGTVPDSASTDISQSQTYSADSSGADPVLNELRERLLKHSVRWVVGEDRGQVSWGRPVAATEDHNGNVVVLDEYMHSVVTIDENGQVLDRQGRAGNGPGEFRGPSGIARGEGHDLVLSQYTGGPIVLAAERGQPLLEAFRIHDAPGATGLCTMAGTAYLRLNSLRVPDQIAAVPLMAQAAPRFFSAPSLPADPMVRRALGRGQVVCSPEADRIIITYGGLPYVHAFSSDGQLAWEAHLEPFTMEETERLSVEGMPGLRRSGKKASDRVHGSVALPGGAVLVRVLRLAPRTLDDSGQFIQHAIRRDTYLFSAFTGESVFVGSDLPAVIYATDRLLIGLMVDPETDTPEVVAYDY